MNIKSYLIGALSLLIAPLCAEPQFFLSLIMNNTGHTLWIENSKGTVLLKVPANKGVKTFLQLPYTQTKLTRSMSYSASIHLVSLKHEDLMLSITKRIKLAHEDEPASANIQASLYNESTKKIISSYEHDIDPAATNDLYVINLELEEDESGNIIAKDEELTVIASYQ